MSELDFYLGPRKTVGDVTTIVGSSDQDSDIHTDGKEGGNGEDDAWLARARSEGPSAWRKSGNPHTDHIAEMLADDAMVALEGTVGKMVRGQAIKLLEELGPELAEEAIQDCRRRESRWRDLNVYLMGNVALQAGARLKRRRWFVARLDEDPVEELGPLDEGLLEEWHSIRAEIVQATTRGFYQTWLIDEPVSLRKEKDQIVVGVPNEGAAERCNEEMVRLGRAGIWFECDGVNEKHAAGE